MKFNVTFLVAFTLRIFIWVPQAGAQDSAQLAQELQQADIADSIKLVKFRNYISSFIASGNIPRAAQALHLVTAAFDNSTYVPFWPFERWYLYVLNKEYNVLVKEVIDSDKLFSFYDTKVKPRDRELQQKMSSYVVQNLLELQKEIDSSEATPEHQRFVQLMLRYMLFTELNLFGQDQLNSMGLQFIDDFKSSSLNPFIRERIIEEYRLSKGGAGFYFGTGTILLTSGLSGHFKNAVPFNYGFDFAFKKFYWGIHASSAVTRTRKAFEYAGLWENNMKSLVLVGSLYLGFDVAAVNQHYYENIVSRCIPYVALGATEFTVNRDGVADFRSLLLSYAFAGVKYDVKFGPKLSTFASYGPLLDYRYFYLRLDPSIGFPIIDEDQRLFDGLLFNIGVQVGLFARIVKKIKY